MPDAQSMLSARLSLLMRLFSILMVVTIVDGASFKPVPGWQILEGDERNGVPEVRGTFQVGHPDVTPGSRTGIASVGGRDLLWVFGGRDIKNNLQSTMFVYWAQAEWSWVTGDNPSMTLQPSAREGSSLTYVSNNSDVVLFGGQTAQGFSNALYRFHYSTFSFTIVSGSSTMMNVKSSLGSGPGGRAHHNTEDDFGSKLFVFGGKGIDGKGEVGLLNDLWSLNEITLKWHLESGSMLKDQRGVYIGDGSSPGARHKSASWLDAVTGDFYVGFGDGFGDVGKGLLSDLFVFRQSTHKFEFLIGEKTVNRPGAYGPVGTYGAFHPGSRRDAGSAFDAEKRRLLLGFGYGYASAADPGVLNDLWAYDIVKEEWMMMAGTQGSVNQRSSKFLPGGRFNCGFAFRKDLMIYGGTGVTFDQSSGTNNSGVLADVWQYVEQQDNYVLTTPWPTAAPTPPTAEPIPPVPGTHAAAIATPIAIILIAIILIIVGRRCVKRRSAKGKENLDPYLGMT